MTPESTKRGRSVLFVLSAASGTGKTTVARQVEARIPGLFYSVSATTRARRPWERDGVDYHFVDRATFQTWLKEGNLLEWAEVYGEYYGTPRKPVMEALEAGRDVLLDLDVVGKRKLEALFPGQVVSIFLFPPSLTVLRERLVTRGVESGKLEVRIQNAIREIEGASEYDYWIVNDDLQEAVDALAAIVQAERQRSVRFPGFPLSLPTEVAS